jgi:hypothetical protein
MSVEAMKQALEALDCINSPLQVWEINKLAGAMNALRQAIAEAEKQEPVAWMQPNGNVYTKKQCSFFSKPPGEEKPNQIPLYAAPVHASDISAERVDETAKREHEFEEMVKKGTKAWVDTPDGWVDDLRGGAEAVAWMWKDGTLTSDPDFADGTWTPLFAAPPKREWVGLTDEEKEAATGWSVEHIEAKLKEKNSL